MRQTTIIIFKTYDALAFYLRAKLTFFATLCRSKVREEDSKLSSELRGTETINYSGKEASLDLALEHAQQ